jgi:hypothetical protein
MCAICPDNQDGCPHIAASAAKHLRGRTNEGLGLQHANGLMKFKDGQAISIADAQLRFVLEQKKHDQNQLDDELLNN